MVPIAKCTRGTPSRHFGTAIESHSEDRVLLYPYDCFPYQAGYLTSTPGWLKAELYHLLKTSLPRRSWQASTTSGCCGYPLVHFSRSPRQPGFGAVIRSPAALILEASKHRNNRWDDVSWQETNFDRLPFYPRQRLSASAANQWIRVWRPSKHSQGFPTEPLQLPREKVYAKLLEAL